MGLDDDVKWNSVANQPVIMQKVSHRDTYMTTSLLVQHRDAHLDFYMTS